MGAVKAAIEAALPGVFVHSIALGSSETTDVLAGYFGNLNAQARRVQGVAGFEAGASAQRSCSLPACLLLACFTGGTPAAPHRPVCASPSQVAAVCDELLSMDQLQQGYVAVGFSQVRRDKGERRMRDMRRCVVLLCAPCSLSSVLRCDCKADGRHPNRPCHLPCALQGGQFMRAVVQRCQHLGPRAHTLVTMGAQHQGVMSVPGCPEPASSGGDGGGNGSTSGSAAGVPEPDSSARGANGGAAGWHGAAGGDAGTSPSLYCRLMQGLIARGAYVSWVQSHVVQAQYVKVSCDLRAGPAAAGSVTAGAPSEAAAAAGASGCDSIGSPGARCRAARLPCQAGVRLLPAQQNLPPRAAFLRPPSAGPLPPTSTSTTPVAACANPLCCFH